MSHGFVTDGAKEIKQDYINNTNSYIIHSRNVQHTDYQQLLQKTVGYNKKVHKLYPAPILLWQKTWPHLNENSQF